MPVAMMKGAVGSPVSAVTQAGFGCSIANRFHQLLDDESDPFDMLLEAERRKQQHKKRDEAAATRRAGLNGRVGGSRRQSQKGSDQLGNSPQQLGQKRALKQGEQQVVNNKGAETKQDKTEWRPSFKEYHSYETERLNRERPITGCGRGRGGMRGRDCNRIGRWEFGICNDEILNRERPITGCGRGRGGMRGRDCNRIGRWEFGICNDEMVAEAGPMKRVVKEMTLDEWKNLQKQNRPKLEFNIRKPETTVPSQAVVIHKSKYSDDLRKEDFEDPSSVFRRPVNDITSQLDINFGSRPCRGARGTWGGRGRGRGRGRGHDREDKETEHQRKVHLVAPNPDDLEAFPALA